MSKLVEEKDYTKQKFRLVICIDKAKKICFQTFLPKIKKNKKIHISKEMA